MAIWLPNYKKVVVSTNRTGDYPRHPSTPGRIVLHTTEGLRLFDYPYPPHFTLGLAGGEHSLKAGKYWTPAGYVTLAVGDEVKHQHCDLNLTNYALLHRSGDPETNHEGIHNVGVEIISMAASPPNWSDRMYGLVAGWLADVVRAIPSLTPALDNYPEKWSAKGSWGFSTPYRVSWDTWQKGLNGLPTLWGHQHVPGNDHWDPGALDIVKLTRMAKDILGGGPVVNPWRLNVIGRLNQHDEELATLRQRVVSLEGR